MVDTALPEHHHLLTIFHQPILVHIHAVCQHLVFEIFLHLGDIDDVPLGQFLKLFIVDICTIQGNDFIMLEMAGGEHEGIVGSGRGELYVTVNSFVCMNDGMHFYASFLLSRLRMPSHTLEDDVRKQGYRGGIDDSQTFYPFLRTIAVGCPKKVCPYWTRKGRGTRPQRTFPSVWCLHLTGYCA